MNDYYVSQQETEIQITMQQTELLQDVAEAAWDVYQRGYEQKQESQLLQAQSMLDGIKTSYALINEAGVIDMGMAGYQTYQATLSFKKALAYFILPIPTTVDEGFAVGYVLKGIYHFVKGLERTIK